MAKEQQYLVHVNGLDEPGITATITGYFGEIGAKLIDIEQTVVFNYLSLHFHIRAGVNLKTLEAELGKRLAEFSLATQVREIQGSIAIPDPANRFVVTIIANDVHPSFIGEATAAIAEFAANIDQIRKLNSGGLETIEFVCSGSKLFSIPQISERLMTVASKYPGVDFAVQKENLYRRSKRLIAFDMDSTLIQGEVIDELAERVGFKKEVEEITREAMEGKIDFQTSLRRRVKFLKGITRADMEHVADSLKLTPGANTLIKVLRKLGYRIAIISGGFTFFAERLKKDLSLHYVYANRLEFMDDQATGEIEGAIVDAQRKSDILEIIAQQEDISLDQVIAIGDGANDVLMLKRAGLGIAFNAKPATRAGADTALTKKSMTSILYLLGITDQEIRAMGFTVSSLHSQKSGE